MKRRSDEMAAASPSVAARVRRAMRSRAVHALAPPGRDAPRGRGLPKIPGGRNLNQQQATMAELRSVDPRTLQLNPNNPRAAPVPPAMDEQMLASINAVGII